MEFCSSENSVTKRVIVKNFLEYSDPAAVIKSNLRIRCGDFRAKMELELAPYHFGRGSYSGELGCADVGLSVKCGWSNAPDRLVRTMGVSSAVKDCEAYEKLKPDSASAAPSWSGVIVSRISVLLIHKILRNNEFRFDLTFVVPPNLVDQSVDGSEGLSTDLGQLLRSGLRKDVFVLTSDNDVIEADRAILNVRSTLISSSRSFQCSCDDKQSIRELLSTKSTVSPRLPVSPTKAMKENLPIREEENSTSSDCCPLSPKVERIHLSNKKYENTPNKNIQKTPNKVMPKVVTFSDEKTYLNKYNSPKLAHSTLKEYVSPLRFSQSPRINSYKHTPDNRSPLRVAQSPRINSYKLTPDNRSPLTFSQSPLTNSHKYTPDNRSPLEFSQSPKLVSKHTPDFSSPFRPIVSKNTPSPFSQKSNSPYPKTQDTLSADSRIKSGKIGIVLPTKRKLFDENFVQNSSSRKRIFTQKHSLKKEVEIPRSPFAKLQHQLREKDELHLETSDHQPKDVTVIKVGLSTNVVQKVLQWIYTGTTDVDHDGRELLMAARRYEIADLETLASNHLIAEMTPWTAWSTLVLARKCDAEQLLRGALDFCVANGKQVTSSADWKASAEEYPELISKMMLQMI